MTTETNKAVVRRYIEEVINRNNFDLIDTLFAPAMREPVRQHLINGGDAFPDGVEEIRDMAACAPLSGVAEGNRVMVWWNFRGTHQGSFFGVPATGKPVDIVGFAIYEFENGQIVDDLMTMDFPPAPPAGRFAPAAGLFLDTPGPYGARHPVVSGANGTLSAAESGGGAQGVRPERGAGVGALRQVGATPLSGAQAAITPP